ncbi:hypothetical protein L596_004455 [Steinernema carpocapsae]|uniref:Uncharacterized protein n=1 Tax=Steinernema carpocapsae TaxID=34508 RepID=A0A4U8UVZ1_STECR|nr:hypothetical protein L596_004455 [Steinernema carpocapsae]
MCVVVFVIGAVQTGAGETKAAGHPAGFTTPRDMWLKDVACANNACRQVEYFAAARPRQLFERYTRLKWACWIYTKCASMSALSHCNVFKQILVPCSLFGTIILSVSVCNPFVSLGQRNVTSFQGFLARDSKLGNLDSAMLASVRLKQWILNLACILALYLVVSYSFFPSSLPRIEKFGTKSYDNLKGLSSKEGRKAESLHIIVTGDELTDNSKKNKSSFKDDQTCRIPKLEKDKPEIMAFYSNPKPLECEKNSANWVLVDNERRLQLTSYAKEKFGSSVECDLEFFFRVNDNRLRQETIKQFAIGSAIEKGDYFLASCRAGSSQWKGALMTIVPNKDRVEEQKKKKQPDNWSGMNVFFMGIDSLSQMAYRRVLPKTVDYFENVMKGVVLNGYNIVGDGTPQAFIPILTAGTELELPLTRKRFKNANYVDVYPFIWNNFSDAGYMTLYGEDAAAIGTFTYRLKGFKKQPTDHYTRTFFQKTEKMGYYKCFGSEPQHKSWLRYSKEFMERYRDLPRFSVMHHAILSHDDISQALIMDDDFTEMFKTMNEAGDFDNSIVILMADHGHRFAKLRETQQGQLEERLPFFGIFMPEKFRESDKGKKAFENLKANADRLSSPFDIHATLMDVLHWPTEEQLSAPQNTSDRSLSLFRPIPESRSCDQAGIEPHWCTCLNWQDAFKDKEQQEISQKLARTVVQVINSKTEPERSLCSPIHFSSLEDAKRLVPHENLLKYKNVKDADGFVPELSGNTKATNALYQLKIRTDPGNALYEVTVHYDMVANSVEVDMTAISHVNKYGDNPHCIIDKNYFLAAYCVCYDKIK